MNDWLEYVDHAAGLCSLCANTGVIDTRESAMSAAGAFPGRLNWCICPNGRQMRETVGPSVPDGILRDTVVVTRYRR